MIAATSANSAFLAPHLHPSTMEQPHAQRGSGTREPARPARVLLVSPQPFFEVRGTPLNVLQMARALGGAGYDVHLATYAIGATVSVPGVTYHRAAAVPTVESVPPGFSWRKVVMDIPLAALVWRLLLTRRFDVVHAVEESAFFVLPIARVRRVPMIYDLDSSISDQLEYSGALRSQALLGLVRRAERAVLARSALAITVCEALTRTVHRLGSGTRVVQIEDCPLDELLLDPTTDEIAALRAEHGLGNAPVVVYTGNLESYQGVDLLIDALPALAARCPGARVLIVGGEAAHIDAARAAVERRGCGPMVTFAGKRPPGQMAAHMALGSALVSPRRSGENTPLKLYSYMHSGVPIVATDLPTHTQVLDQATAVLCPPEPEALGAALARVLLHPSDHREQARAARERVQRHYSAEAFRDKLLAAYRLVLDGSRTSSTSSM
jgi:glycosyltransferase involved in cell wall biosynthesis